ncbi:MAG TPA: hypothetical protein VHG70_15755 [Nocardioidaceae bacterium]|nr:hypothetical protein [Nocardioidaceae bacterium]
MSEHFKQSWGGWISSSQGYAIRVGRRTGIDYRDPDGRIRIDAEAMSDTWYDVVVYTGSIPASPERHAPRCWTGFGERSSSPACG